MAEPKAVDQAALVEILSKVENKTLVQFDFDPYLFSLALTFDDGSILDITANSEKQLNVDYEISEDDGE